MSGSGNPGLPQDVAGTAAVPPVSRPITSRPPEFPSINLSTANSPPGSASTAASAGGEGAQAQQRNKLQTSRSVRIRTAATELANRPNSNSHNSLNDTQPTTSAPASIDVFDALLRGEQDKLEVL